MVYSESKKTIWTSVFCVCVFVYVYKKGYKAKSSLILMDGEEPYGFFRKSQMTQKVKSYPDNIAIRCGEYLDRSAMSDC